jgi:hypothetical protein
MSISTLRDELREQTVAFAWSQWAQMGVLADADRDDRWAADPEALLLFTLEIARDDPRLFDETLDWLLTNEKLMSAQRLRNLARDAEDRALIEAALAWTAARRPRTGRAGSRTKSIPSQAPTATLFRQTQTKVETPDEDFLRHGLMRAPLAPSGKSRTPQLRNPINFAFRMRSLLGVGARAETVRVLLGTSAQALSVHDIAQGAGYAKRNVQDALSSLHAAGTITATTTGNERRYSIDRYRWAQLLALTPDELPVYRNWIALLGALRHLTRWLTDPANEKLSDYMRASNARELMDEITPNLHAADIHVDEHPPTGPEYWSAFTSTTRAAAQALSAA